MVEITIINLINVLDEVVNHVNVTISNATI